MTNSRSKSLYVVVRALFVASCANTVRGVSLDIKDTANAVDEAVN